MLRPVLFVLLLALLVVIGGLMIVDYEEVHDVGKELQLPIEPVE